MKLFDKYLGKAKTKVKTLNDLWLDYEKWCRENHKRIIGGPAGMASFRNFLSEYPGVTDLTEVKEGKKNEDVGRLLFFKGKYNDKPFKVNGSSQGIGIFIREA